MEEMVFNSILCSLYRKRSKACSWLQATLRRLQDIQWVNEKLAAASFGLETNQICPKSVICTLLSLPGGIYVDARYQPIQKEYYSLRPILPVANTDVSTIKICLDTSI
jgi:hypothetical protein